MTCKSFYTCGAFLSSAKLIRMRTILDQERLLGYTHILEILCQSALARFSGEYLHVTCIYFYGQHCQRILSKHGCLLSNLILKLHVSIVWLS